MARRQVNYRTPPFEELPGGPDLRWVGSTIMDEEQYRVERWECTVIGESTYWRCHIPGVLEYARLRQSRRADRKARWQARQDDEADEYQQWMTGLAQEYGQ
jgi:hypothetical protein